MSFPRECPSFQPEKIWIFKTGYNCSILYGRYALLQAGAFETADAEYAFQTDRRKRNFERDSKYVRNSPRELFIEALQRNAVYIILLHNHPSGDPTPSPDDLQITARIYQAGELLGIHLLDHIVIGDQRYCSFREEGLWNTCTE